MVSVYSVCYICGGGLKHRQVGSLKEIKQGGIRLDYLENDADLMLKEIIGEKSKKKEEEENCRTARMDEIIEGDEPLFAE